MQVGCTTHPRALELCALPTRLGIACVALCAQVTYPLIAEFIRFAKQRAFDRRGSQPELISGGQHDLPMQRRCDPIEGKGMLPMAGRIPAAWCHGVKAFVARLPADALPTCRPRTRARCASPRMKATEKRSSRRRRSARVARTADILRIEAGRAELGPHTFRATSAAICSRSSAFNIGATTMGYGLGGRARLVQHKGPACDRPSSAMGLLAQRLTSRSARGVQQVDNVHVIVTMATPPPPAGRTFHSS